MKLSHSLHSRRRVTGQMAVDRPACLKFRYPIIAVHSVVSPQTGTGLSSWRQHPVFISEPLNRSASFSYSLIVIHARTVSECQQPAVMVFMATPACIKLRQCLYFLFLSDFPVWFPKRHAALLDACMNMVHWWHLETENKSPHMVHWTWNLLLHW